MHEKEARSDDDQQSARDKGSHCPKPHVADLLEPLVLEHLSNFGIGRHCNGITDSCTGAGPLGGVDSLQLLPFVRCIRGERATPSIPLGAKWTGEIECSIDDLSDGDQDSNDRHEADCITVDL